MSKDTWSVNKSIPLSVVIGIGAYTITAIWFFADLENNVVSNKERIVKDEARIEVLENLVQTQAVSMARIDENIKAIRSMAEHWSGTK
tara:strand:+ start:2328 stop:2591 length:264 start_codon:yes stop_codon:yes gene_type:complete